MCGENLAGALPPPLLAEQLTCGVSLIPRPKTNNYFHCSIPHVVGTTLIQILHKRKPRARGVTATSDRDGDGLASAPLTLVLHWRRWRRAPWPHGCRSWVPDHRAKNGRTVYP